MPVMSARIVPASADEVFAVGMTYTGNINSGPRYLIVLRRTGNSWKVVKHDLTGDTLLDRPDTALLPNDVQGVQLSLARRGRTLVVAGKANAATKPGTSPLSAADYAAVSVSTDGGVTWSVKWAPVSVPVLSSSAVGVSDPNRSVFTQAILANELGFVAAVSVNLFSANGLIASVGQYLAFSEDALTWSLASHPNIHSGFTSPNRVGVLHTGAASPGSFAVVCGDGFGSGLTRYLRSTNGLTWSAASYDVEPVNGAIAYTKNFGFSTIFEITEAVPVMHVANSADAASWASVSTA